MVSEHDLLGQMTGQDIACLLDRAEARRHGDAVLLFQKGDPGDGLFVVLDGLVKIYALSEDGREIILNVMSEGDLFGEIALLDGKARTAAAATMGDALLVKIHRKDVLELMERRPEIARRFIDILCARVRWISQTYEQAVLMHFPARLAKKLLLLAELYGQAAGGATRITIRLSQQDLANMVGASREIVNRQLREWQRLKLLSMGGGRMTILRPKELATIGG
jgi:CRP-like cAMP-binding protein